MRRPPRLRALPTATSTSGRASRIATCSARNVSSHSSSLSRKANRRPVAARKAALRAGPGPRSAAAAPARAHRGREAARDLHRPVRRAIVHNQQLQIAERLAQHRLDRARQIALGVVRRHDHADGRHASSGRRGRRRCWVRLAGCACGVDACEIGSSADRFVERVGAASVAVPGSWNRSAATARRVADALTDPRARARSRRPCRPPAGRLGRRPRASARSPDECWRA